MTAPRPPDSADRVVDAVDDALDPAAPTTAAAPVDVAVVPPAVRSPVHRWLPVVIVGASGLAAVAVAVAHPGSVVWRWDEALHSWALAHRAPADASFARAVTWGGVTTVALPALVVLGAWARRGPVELRTRLGAGIALGAAGALGVWLGLLLNHQMDRARPPVVDWWAAAGGPAFPSGHTTASTVVAGLAAWALAQRATSRRGRSAVWGAAAAYAILVGWSRYWLGVHWPSDVVGGWLLGAAWVALVVGVVSAARRRSVPGHALEA
jgi:membrane-associated phospholipid phosphatase